MDLSRIVCAAVRLKDFDTRSTRIVMSPLSRIPERPDGLPGAARSGAVLAVLFAKEGKMHVILIRRCENLQHHPGQISFPGGRREQREEPLACALRETREEIGIEPGDLTIAGALEPAYILASDFEVSPFVAWHPGIPSCRPEPREVDCIFRVPLALLRAPGARTHELHSVLGSMRRVPGFSLHGHHIWGATAILLHEIIERLTAAGWRE